MYSMLLFALPKFSLYLFQAKYIKEFSMVLVVLKKISNYLLSNFDFIFIQNFLLVQGIKCTLMEPKNFVEVLE